MSLYYALLHLWMGMGDSEAIVRFLSVLLGLAAVVALYVLGNRLFGKPLGLIASSLLSINGFHIQHSQEARGYSLLVLLTIISSLFFLSSIERPTRRNWLGYILTTVLAIYAHVFAVLVAAAHWSSLVFLRRRDVPWKALFASTAIIGALTSPLGILLLSRSRDIPELLAWADKPTLHDVYNVFYMLAGNVDFNGSGLPGGHPALVAYFVVCLIALLSGIRMWRSSGKSVDAWRLGLLLSWLFVPIVLALAVSIVKSIFVVRYLLICLPPLVLLAAKGTHSVRPKWLAAAALATTVGLGAFALLPYYRFRSNVHTWQTTTDTILAESRRGDAAIFCVAPGRLCFDYYRKRYHGSENNVDVVYPEFGDEVGPKVLYYLPPVGSELLDYVTTHYHRIWVVLYHDWDVLPGRMSHRIQASLSAKYQKIRESRIDEGTSERVTLLLYASGSVDQEVKPTESNLSVEKTLAGFRLLRGPFTTEPVLRQAEIAEGHNGPRTQQR